MCQDDSEPVRDVAADLILWFGNDRERQHQLLAWLLDQSDLSDVSADDLLQSITGKQHDNLLVI